MFSILRVPVILYAYVRMRWLAYHLRSRQRLESWQRGQLTRHLRYIKRHSPYFRERLADVTLEAWRALPILGKGELMDRFSDINTRGISREAALSVAVEAERSRNFAPTVEGVTVGLSSGTSGHRGIFMASAWEQWMYAGTALAKILPGFWRRKNRVAFFLRANNNLYTAVRSQRLRFEYFDLLLPVSGHFERLERVQPTLLIAPPSLLVQLAEAQKNGRIHLRPKKIVSVAEVLDPVDEKFIADVFAQRVHQVYQATEGFLAATCAHGTLHLNEDMMVIEKDWLDEASGRFQPIITDFSRKTQPIVRYRLNDVLTERRVPCACGSPLTALEFIEGRSDDLFYLPSVSGVQTVAVYPDFIRRALLFASDQISDYRVVQTGHSHLQIYVLCRGDEKPVQIAVRREINDLAQKLGCIVDNIEFVGKPTATSVSEGRKLRRVINQYSPVNSHTL